MAYDPIIILYCKLYCFALYVKIIYVQTCGVYFHE